MGLIIENFVFEKKNFKRILNPVVQPPKRSQCGRNVIPIFSPCFSAILRQDVSNFIDTPKKERKQTYILAEYVHSRRYPDQKLLPGSIVLPTTKVIPSSVFRQHVSVIFFFRFLRTILSEYRKSYYIQAFILL